VELLKDRLEDLEEAQSQLQVCGVSLPSFIHYAIVWRTVPMNFIYFFKDFFCFYIKLNVNI
jgi:hypothetical protein